MLDILKRAHYRRRFGEERGELVLRVERAMRALPPAQLSEAWVAWFWRQPPEEWESILKVRQDGGHDPSEPPSDETTIPAPRTQKEVASFIRRVELEMSTLRASVQRSAATIDPSPFYRARRLIEELTTPDFTTGGRAKAHRRRHRRALANIERLARERPRLPQVSDPGRWADWIGSLPIQAREEATQIKALFATMEGVHRVLAEAIEKCRNPASSADEIQAAERCLRKLSSWIRACDEEYAEVAEPFFEKYGRPNLSK